MPPCPFWARQWSSFQKDQTPQLASPSLNPVFHLVLTSMPLSAIVTPSWQVWHYSYGDALYFSLFIARIVLSHHRSLMSLSELLSAHALGRKLPCDHVVLTGIFHSFPLQVYHVCSSRSCLPRTHAGVLSGNF